jgi:serine protease Do
LKDGHPASVKLAWVGATGQAVTSDIARSLGLARPGGVLIKEVYPGGPLARAGVGSGDVVETVDGAAVDDMQSLNYRTATHRAGDTVKMRVLSNGKTREVAVVLALPPENPARDLRTVAGRNPLTGARVENVSPATATELQIDLMSKGAAIVSTENGTIAANYGFQPGDIIRSVNGQRIASVAELVRALNASSRWDLVIERGGRQLTLSVQG